MRVVAGEKGGRRLVAPLGTRTRPTAERVREAAFSMLESYLGLRRGGIAGTIVWDLFAGSGALGIEALSRGAAHVTFVDNARAAVSTVRANLARLGYGPERAEVCCADVLRWAQAPSARGGVPFARPDLVLADPPYAWEGWPVLFKLLEPLRPLVVAESGSSIELPVGWSALRQRSYGGSLITLASPDASPESTGDEVSTL
jgi:16S rRNA (guanine966-N2)-methyltransferase